MAHKKIGTQLASDIAEKIAKKAFEHLIPVLEEQLREIGRGATPNTSSASWSPAISTT